MCGTLIVVDDQDTSDIIPPRRTFCLTFLSRQDLTVVDFFPYFP